VNGAFDLNSAASANANANANSSANANADAKQLKRTTKALAAASEAIIRYNEDVPRLRATWQQEKETLERELEFFRDYQGQDTSEHILLRKGERFFAVVIAGLIEERAGRATYVGKRQGFSIPIGSIGGQSIRYNTGVSSGQLERAAPVQTTIDVGMFIITNQRIVFTGEKQTRECLFTKLISIEHPYTNRTVVAVSNRQKATILSYDVKASEVVRTTTTLATADFRGTRAELVDARAQALANLERQQPAVLALPTFDQVSRPDYRLPEAVTRHQASALNGAQASAGTDSSATVSFVLGMLSFLLLCWVPVLGMASSIAAIIFGARALKARTSSRSLALWGTVLASLALVTASVVTVLTIVALLQPTP